VEELARVVDEVVTLRTVRGHFSVGSFYSRFEQTSDREVDGYLRRAQRIAPRRGGTVTDSWTWVAPVRRSP
jgi:predicted phosphoribosyltransferase